MKFIGLFFLAVTAINILSCGNSTGGNSKVSMQNAKNMTDNTNDLEKLSGLKLPVSAKVLSKIGEGGHDGTKYKRWIVSSSEPPTLLGTTIDGDDNQTFIETLKEAMPNEAVGNPVGQKYQFSDWKNEQGQWQAAYVETDKGFYLNLENIILE